jgi:hypothetical protein
MSDEPGTASAPYDMNRDRAIRTAKVQALREAADDLDQYGTHMASNFWYTGWLRKRAEQIERGEA